MSENSVTIARDVLQLKPVSELSQQDQAAIMQHVEKVKMRDGPIRLVYGRIGLVPIINVNNMREKVYPQFGLIKQSTAEYIFLYPYNSGIMNGGSEGDSWFVDSCVISVMDHELFERTQLCCKAYIAKEETLKNKVGGDDMLGALEL